MISTRQLASRTGYSINYICGLVRSGELKPVGEINGGHAFNPDALAPKPDSGRRKADDPLSIAKASPYRICGFCTSYGNLCSQTGKRVAYHRVACEVYSQDLDAIERAIRPPSPPPTEVKTYFIEVNEMAKITPEIRETVLREYAASKSINAAAKAAGIDWAKAKQIIKEYGDAPFDHINAEVEILVETQPESKPEPKPTPDLSILHHDLELAQQAMALIDTVRQVWGDVEPVRDAILQEYARRRVQ